jgi:hypothetical protein
MNVLQLIPILFAVVICGCKVPTQQAHQPHPLVVDYPSANQVAAGKIYHELDKVPECRNYQQKLYSDISTQWDDFAEQVVDSYPGGYGIEAKFKLHQDGSVSDISVVYYRGSTASGSTKALVTSIWTQVVKDCSPFSPWPDKMRSIVGRESLDIYFGFGFNLRVNPLNMPPNTALEPTPTAP